MADDLKPAARAELYGLVRDRKMIEAVKHLRRQGMDHRTSKELVEKVHRELDPDAAIAREKTLAAVIRDVGTQEE